MSDQVRIVDLSDDELLGAAIMASGLLLIESAKAYGFVKGGADIDTDRCDEMIAAARDRGLAWTSLEAETAAIALAREWSER
jgi:hypothetical protein